ncbi:SDR family NAD(P)-dependent oxidoreductase [Mucilaginibacter sp. BJC16-A38]|uniref:SDR family NAD(P)-dependent oxidoreductase n=1 Tax=Mucilaginibacter phenanthrenivorans TaxID=1234842 RepID=UPI0021574BC2|nr:SDR family NAD(P)-dependent oxidoreductase [Mucilaginibacter phenanthrenivorans]MCR8556419.1 SDR family NAD(P)-dependent oxidoreductase [Mucilaginibacter phenanthrenivorans]
MKNDKIIENKVWFVTGASKGFGLSLVKQLLAAGHKVAATSRYVSSLVKAVGDISDNFLPLYVNLADEKSVAEAIQITVGTFDKIDVVINNAGYGIGGSVEELTDEEARESFDINVFGTLNVIREVMPFMRERKSGHIINISSIAGIAPGTGWALYAATKFAVIGLSEVLADDVKSMGIKVTVVAPGAFRTNFLTGDSLVMTKKPIHDYQEVRDSHTRYLQMDGHQAGDPEKAAAAMISLADDDNPPVHLLLGEDAYTRAMTKLGVLEKEFRLNEELSKSMAYQG